MNQSRAKSLRRLFLSDLQFPVGDPRNNLIWKRFKRAFNRVPRPDRDPNRLQPALARAMRSMSTAP